MYRVGGKHKIHLHYSFFFIWTKKNEAFNEWCVSADLFEWLRTNLFYFQCLKIDFRFFLFLLLYLLGLFSSLCFFLERSKRGVYRCLSFLAYFFGNTNVNECVDCVSVCILRVCYRISFFVAVDVVVIIFFYSFSRICVTNGAMNELYTEHSVCRCCCCRRRRKTRQPIKYLYPKTILKQQPTNLHQRRKLFQTSQ